MGVPVYRGNGVKERNDGVVLVSYTETPTPRHSDTVLTRLDAPGAPSYAGWGTRREVSDAGPPLGRDAGLLRIGIYPHAFITQGTYMITRDLRTARRAEAYRVLSSLVVPRPIAWVTTLGESGVVNLAPFSSCWMSFWSMRPSESGMRSSAAPTPPSGSPWRAW